MNILIRLSDKIIYLPGIKPETVEDLSGGFLLTSTGASLEPPQASMLSTLGLLNIRPTIELDPEVRPLFESLKAELTRQKATQVRDLAFNLGGLREPIQ